MKELGCTVELAPYIELELFAENEDFAQVIVVDSGCTCFA